MPQQLNQGILIALEGIDGSGKSTLANNLFALLHEKQFNVLLTKEPSTTALGQKVRELIHHQDIPFCSRAEYLLFAADRAQHFSEVIIPALAQKKLIISDRMADSSLAYQGYGNKLDLAMIRTINSWTMNSITPDITIFIRVPVAVALERANKRGALSAYEKKEAFLHDVAHGFEELYKNRNDVIIVDGTLQQKTLTAHVCNEIEQWIKAKNLL
jgi:dTMP kinase